jgi:membrane protein DedA with SNARE-associated domain
MSNIRPAQYLLFSIASGLVWATAVSTTGYFVGRFLNLKTSVFEKNIVFIVIGFALFGLLTGYIVKRFAYKKISSEA